MEEGELKIFNPDKEISKEITLDILIRHRDAMKQARNGVLPNIPLDKLTDNDRRFNQVRALNLIISAQREMITIARPIIYFRSLQKCKKDNKEDKDNIQLLTIFEERDKDYNTFKYDYNKLRYWLGFLKACEQDILEADKTKCLKDDFIIKKDSLDGEKFELTPNFFSMLEELENSYEQIYLILIINKIVSAGIEEDEELTYKQKEEEAIRRVVEA